MRSQRSLSRPFPPPSSNPWNVSSYSSNSASSSHIRLPINQSSSSIAMALGDPHKTHSMLSSAYQHNKPITPVHQPPPVTSDAKVRPSTPPPQSVSEFKTPIKPSDPDSTLSSPDPLAIRHPFVETIVPSTSPSKLPNTPITSSPDPLAFLPSGSDSITPRKRKPVPLVSPSLKRTNSSNLSIAISRQSSQTSTSSDQLTPGGTIRPKKLFWGVEIPHPPKGFSTPSTSGRSKSAPSSKDLGGFSPPDSEWDEEGSVKRSVSKSSGKRTGDRDDRGIHSFF